MNGELDMGNPEVVAWAEKMLRRRIVRNKASMVVTYFMIGYWPIAALRFAIQHNWTMLIVCIALFVFARITLNWEREVLTRTRHAHAMIFEWGRELADR